MEIPEEKEPEIIRELLPEEFDAMLHQAWLNQQATAEALRRQFTFRENGLLLHNSLRMCGL